MTPDPKPALPAAPRLPERAAIYIAKDGTVHFGALFEGLVPVARALGGQVDAAAEGPTAACADERISPDPAGLATTK